MTKLTDKQLKDLIREAGEQFTLSASHKTAMRFHLMDVIKSGEARTSKQSISHILNPRRFAMPLIPIIIAAIIALGGGTATLANSAKPGDALYSVDQWMEQVQERMTTRVEAKARLYANLSDERLQELAEIRAMDPAQMTEAIKQRWEEHQAEAVERMTKQIEQITTLQEQFIEKLNSATDEAQKAVFQKIVDHLKDVQAKREEKLNTLSKLDTPSWNLGQKMSAFRQERQKEMQEMRNEMVKEFQEAVSREATSDDESENKDATSNVQTQTQNRNGQSGTANQTTLEFRIPVDINGNVDLDMTDTDHDGIPDKWDNQPNWPPHTMGA